MEHFFAENNSIHVGVGARQSIFISLKDRLNCYEQLQDVPQERKLSLLGGTWKEYQGGTTNNKYGLLLNKYQVTSYK